MRSPGFSVSLPAQALPRLKRPVEGLLLDSCNILYDATGWHRWLHQVLRRMGVRAQYGCLFHVWQKDYLPSVYRGQCRQCDALRLFLQALGLSRGQIEEVATTCEARRIRWEAETRLLPGVKATLCHVAAARIPIAVVSDTGLSAAEVLERLQAMGLPDILAGVVSSRDLGRVKPDPACYEAALKLLRLSARQAAFVGHDAEELAGAARLGMQTIAFNPTHDVEADLLLTRFRELLDLIGVPTGRRSMAG
ncbi:MAG: HAD family hydrolase [Thermoguttaceae bacterium]